MSLVASAAYSSAFSILDKRFYNGVTEYLVKFTSSQRLSSCVWFETAKLLRWLSYNNCNSLLVAFNNWYNHSRRGCPPTISNRNTSGNYFTVHDKNVSKYFYRQLPLNSFATRLMTHILLLINENGFDFTVGFLDKPQSMPGFPLDKKWVEWQCFVSVMKSWLFLFPRTIYVVYPHIVGHNCLTASEANELDAVINSSFSADFSYKTVQEVLLWIPLNLSINHPVCLLVTDQYAGLRNLTSLLVIVYTRGNNGNTGVYIHHFMSINPIIKFPYASYQDMYSKAYAIRDSLMNSHQGVKVASQHFGYSMTTVDSLFRCLHYVSRLLDGETFEEINHSLETD